MVWATGILSPHQELNRKRSTVLGPALIRQLIIKHSENQRQTLSDGNGRATLLVKQTKIGHKL